MHIAFGSAPSFLCSRTPSTRTLPLSPFLGPSFCPTVPPNGSPRRECKLILSCIKLRVLLTLDLFVPRHPRAVSNDIYAILIEYLLYMRLHTTCPIPRSVYDSDLISSHWHGSDHSQKSVVRNEILTVDAHWFADTSWTVQFSPDLVYHLAHGS